MKTVLIPNTELEVSKICIGTMTFGDRLDQKQADNAVAMALDAGINFFDTANIYPIFKNGVSEQMLCKALGSRKNEVVIATKVGGPMGPGPDDRGLGAKHMPESVEGSLKRLGVDCIDLLYFHVPDPDTPMEESIIAANDLIKQGKIRHYGVSNYSAWQMCEMVMTAKNLGLQPPAATENVYNLLTRDAESELLPFLKKYPMGLTVFNPLSGGMLTGKYTSMQPPVGTRFEDNPGYRARYFSEGNLSAAARLDALAKESGRSLIGMSLQWLIESDMVHSVILGFSSPEQLKQNLDAANEPGTAPIPYAELDAVWKALPHDRFSYHK